MDDQKMKLEKRMEETRRMVEGSELEVNNHDDSPYVVEIIDIKPTLSNELIVLVVCDDGIHYLIEGSGEIFVLGVNRKESIKSYNDMVDKLICVGLIKGY